MNADSPRLPVPAVSPRRPHPAAKPHAVALVIVLAFVVLLTGLVVAFFSRALLDRQISNSSANQTRVDLFAQGAADTIVADVQQEIAAGSTAATPAAGVTVYTPKVPATAAPAQVGLPAAPAVGYENLLKRSARGLAFYPPTNYDANASNRAAAVSTLAPSLNGRAISPARWNKHLLLQKQSFAANGAQDTNDTDFTPVGATAATGGTAASWANAPDWILVDRNGANPTGAFSANMAASPTVATSVVGRFAYAMYDEGGLLDMNVAGYPSVMSPQQTGYKNTLAYADLRQLPGIGPVTAGGTACLTTVQQDALLNALVGWRNGVSASTNFSAQPTPVAAAPPLAGMFPNYQWSASSTPAYSVNYANLQASATSGFLKSGNPLLIGGQTDRMFSSRQELLKLILQGVVPSGSTGASERANLQNAVRYLGTFSRTINQPSFSFDKTSPLVVLPANGGTLANGNDGLINPGKANTTGGTPPYPAGFLSIVVQNPFTRADNSNAVVGEPLVKKRFALNRLAWLTCNGPIAGDDGSLNPLGDPVIGAIITQLQTLGVPQTLLQQGTRKNIIKYFGLVWDTGNRRWVYNQHNGTSGTGATGAITRVGAIPALTGSGLHEPDFFELLKAAIDVGSLGKSIVNQVSDGMTLAPGYSTGGGMAASFPHGNQYKLDSSTDYQVMQIGANIIEQANVAGFPIRFAFDAGNGPQQFEGVENLPYLYHVHYGAVQVALATTPPPTLANSFPPAILTSDPTNGTLTTGGVGVLLQIPTLWNPHDINAARPPTVNGQKLFPTKFRVLADSTDNVNGGAYDSYYVYAYGNNTTSGGLTPGGVTKYSYSVTPTLPGAFAGQTGRTARQPLTAATTELDFTVDPAVNDTTGTLFREPTALCQQGYAGLSSVNPLLAGGLHAVNPTPTGTQSPESAPAANFTGVYLGAFPLRWTAFDTSSPPNSYSLTCAQAQCARYNTTAATAGGDDITNCFVTYRLQCQDGTGNWIDYDTKYVSTFMSLKSTSASPGTIGQGTMPVAYNSPKGILVAPLVGVNDYGGTSGVCDPRTSRFGMLNGGVSIAESDDQAGIPFPEEIGNYGSGGFSGSIGSWTRGYVDPANAVMVSDRGDQSMGCGYWIQGGGSQVGAFGPLALPTSGWTVDRMTLNTTPWALRVGMYSQNDPDYPSSQVPVRGLDDTKLSTPTGAPYYETVYYSDPDGVVRRAMGAYVGPRNEGRPNDQPQPFNTPGSVNYSQSTTIGLPMARARNYVGSVPANYNYPANYPANGIATDQTVAQNQFQSRPTILHRPFRTVAELGYTFTGTPWKNLDFFTPESPDAGLLDIFCINSTDDANGLVAGVIDLNTRQVPVLQAVLAGAYKDEAKSASGLASLFISGTLPASNAEANALATTLVTRTTAGNTNTSNAPTPLFNVSQLVGKWRGTGTAVPAAPSPPPPYTVYDGSASYDGFSKDVDNLVYAQGLANASYSNDNIQRFHEAPIRALASAGQTRVWNLLIDVVAQTGIYPTTAVNAASPLAAFSVQGEQRYWVHVAIDRFTGKVLDKQIELVKE